MAHTERYENDPRYEYLKIAEDIVLLPEAHRYTVTHLVPSLNMDYELVGFMAAFPPIQRGLGDMCIVRLYKDTYCGTVLFSRLMALNGDRQAMERLRENPRESRPSVLHTPTDLFNSLAESKLPNAIMAFYSATEQLSVIEPEIALLTPPGADKMQAYDKLLRLSYGILSELLPSNARNQ